LEFIISELSDYFALGYSLSFPEREADKHTGDLEAEVSHFRCLNYPRKGTHERSIGRCYHYRFHRANLS
jgi:hypothetical protein